MSATVRQSMREVPIRFSASMASVASVNAVGLKSFANGELLSDARRNIYRERSSLPLFAVELDMPAVGMTSNEIDVRLELVMPFVMHLEDQFHA